MSDPNIEVKFTARTDGVEQGAAGAAQAIQNAVAQMRSGFEGLGSAIKGVQSQIEGMLSGVQAGFAKFNNVMFAVQNAIAGGDMFKEFVASAMETAKQSVALGNAFGITATQASTLRVAAAGVGVSADALQSAGTRLTRTLGTNEDAFKNLGVATRDSNGNFRSTGDIMTDVNARLRDFAAGTDRNIEGMKIYGRGWAEIAPLVNKFKGETEESRQEAAALNLVVGQESVDAMLRYKEAHEGVGLVMEGLKNTIGQALMPGLTQMAEWFRSIGPQAIEVTRGVMATWLSVVDNVKAAVMTLWNTLVDMSTGVISAINAAFGRDSEPMTGMQFVENVLKVVQVAFIGLRVGIQEACEFIKSYILALVQDFRTFADVAVAALHFDWAGVKQAWKDGTGAAEKIMQDSMRKMVDIAAKGRADIEAALAGKPLAAPKVTPVATKGDGERSDGSDKSGQEKDRTGRWSAELKAAQDTFALEHSLKQQDLADDVTFWEQKLALTKNGTEAEAAERAKVNAKLMDAKLALMKRDVEQGRAMSEEAVNDAEKSGLDSLALVKAQYDQKLQLGLISKADMIAVEQDLENQKLAIEESAQQARIALVENDPNHSPAALQKEKDKLLEIERQHALAVQQLRTQASVEDQKYALEFGKSLEQGLTSVIQKFAQGTLSIKGLLIGMGQAVLSSLTQIFAEIAAKWLVKEAMQTAATAAGTAARSAIELGAAAESVALWGATAIKNIMSSAWEAMAGAYKALVGIPIIGPVLAPIAAGAAFVTVAGYASHIASAAGGYDIPANVNPLVQVHEKEMILPAKQADVIRDMADGGGSGGGHLYVTTQRLPNGMHLISESDFVKIAKRADRNFNFSNLKS